MKDVVDRALGYPYDVPETSYLLVRGQVQPINEAALDLKDRHPVLASGSNQSAAQLIRKFGDDHDAAIPVLETHVENMDAVYSAHFSAYGAVPATLVPMPGTCVRLFVTWLTDEQLDRMHATEALGKNYDFVRLDGLALRSHHKQTNTHAFAYLSRWGCVDFGKGPIALAEISAEGRTGPQHSQAEMQNLLRGKLAPDCALDAFVVGNASNADHRAQHTQRLPKSVAPAWPPGIQANASITGKK